MQIHITMIQQNGQVQLGTLSTVMLKLKYRELGEFMESATSDTAITLQDIYNVYPDVESSEVLGRLMQYIKVPAIPAYIWKYLTLNFRNKKEGVVEDE